MSDSDSTHPSRQARRTATTGNAILGLLALRASWSTWEIRTQLRRNMRFFWPRAESRIYAEAKGLVDKGLARAERTRHGRRIRTTYAITPAGEEALRDWLATPPRGTHLECEPLLRILLGDHGTPDQLERALAQVEADAAEILAVGRTVAREYRAGTAPFQHQVHLRVFVFDFLSSHALMLLGWAARTRAELARWPHSSHEERAERAVRTISEIEQRFPAGPE